jgi:hypothetical protein
VNACAGGVLIHCAAGRSRSAAIAVAYIMRTERQSCEAALASVRRVRWICPNVGFQQQLRLWEELRCDAAAWPAPESPAWPKEVSNICYRNRKTHLLHACMQLRMERTK